MGPVVLEGLKERKGREGEGLNRRETPQEKTSSFRDEKGKARSEGKVLGGWTEWKTSNVVKRKESVSGGVLADSFSVCIILGLAACRRFDSFLIMKAWREGKIGGKREGKRGVGGSK